jgi:hypothetical protein
MKKSTILFLLGIGSLLFTLLQPSCSEPEKAIKEIRVYDIKNASADDTVWVDTLDISGRPITQPTPTYLIHDIDSILKSGISDSLFHTVDAEVEVSRRVASAHGEIVCYFVSFPIQEPIYTFYGVFTKDIGTIFWRSLDGHKKYFLRKRIIGRQITDYQYLILYLQDSILKPPKKPTESRGSGE